MAVLMLDVAVLLYFTVKAPDTRVAYVDSRGLITASETDAPAGMLPTWDDMRHLGCWNQVEMLENCNFTSTRVAFTA